METGGLGPIGVSVVAVLEYCWWDAVGGKYLANDVRLDEVIVAWLVEVVVVGGSDGDGY